jgi:Ca2+/Na+ antiporter
MGFICVWNTGLLNRGNQFESTRRLRIEKNFQKETFVCLLVIYVFVSVFLGFYVSQVVMMLRLCHFMTFIKHVGTCECSIEFINN